MSPPTIIGMPVMTAMVTAMIIGMMTTPTMIIMLMVVPATFTRRNPKLFGLVWKDITQGIKAEPGQVVAISGRSISRDKHLWGDIAAQLGKADKFLEFYKGAPVARRRRIGLI